MKLSFQSKKSPAYLFNYLTDMQKFSAAHPVITRIDKTSDNSYLVYETLKLGFIPVSFTYPATITFKGNTVYMHATVMKFTKVEMIFTIKVCEDFTLIEEQINFSTPLPVTSTLQKVFKTQHEQLFRNIELTT